MYNGKITMCELCNKQQRFVKCATMIIYVNNTRL